MAESTREYEIVIQNKNISMKELKSLSIIIPNRNQSKKLFNELRSIINKSDWLTIGIMSPSLEIGINIIRKIEEKFECNKMKCVTLPSSEGPIFLKANQKTGEIHARIEFGLGEGILISCHNDDNTIT